MLFAKNVPNTEKKAICRFAQTELVRTVTDLFQTNNLIAI